VATPARGARRRRLSLFRSGKAGSVHLALVPATLATLALCALSFAQQFEDPQSELAPLESQPTPQARVPQTGTAPSPATSETPPEKHERILGVIPAFGVTNLRHAPSLTPSEKFKLFARQAFDPFQWVAAGAQAGLSQAENTWPAYGQGAAGYGKRYGADVADVTDREFMSDFLFPVLLKQDPRYFRLGHGSIKHRAAYSLAQEFWCKSDKETRQFNFSKVLGAFAAKAASNLYYPPSDRGLGLTMRRSDTSILSGMASGLGAEFWPDISCKLFHKCGGI